MKILLLTDIPPCQGFTAGLVLDRLCRFLPKGSIVCFALTNPDLDPKLSPDLSWIPTAYGKKRNETSLLPDLRRLSAVLVHRANVSPWFRVLFSPLLGIGAIIRLAVPSRLHRLFFFPASWLLEKLRRVFVVPRLAKQVVAFGRRHNVDVVWAVLQGQTVTQIAADVAERLNATLITQVWDPLSWWLHDNQIDRFNRRSALADFDRALRKSRTCLTASWAMTEDYERRYGPRSVPVIASHPKSVARSPDLSRFPDDEIHIGMAGQFYAGDEWLHFLRALNMSGWQVRGRPVRITVLGGAAPPGKSPPGRVQYLGWQSQADAARLLSELDVLYCPYPFAPHMADVMMLSFPSKVVLYLAAGRPILFHGPAVSSPAVYLQKHRAAVIIGDLHSAAIYNGLCRLVDHPDLYNELGRNAQRAFLADFTLETMRDNFERALGVPLNEIAAETSPAEAPEPIYYPDVRALIPGTGPILARLRAVLLRLAKMSQRLGRATIDR